MVGNGPCDTNSLLGIVAFVGRTLLFALKLSRPSFTSSYASTYSVPVLAIQIAMLAGGSPVSAASWLSRTWSVEVMCDAPPFASRCAESRVAEKD